MPEFGHYLADGDPLRRREDAGHVSEVWLARRADATDGRLYAIKVYHPARSKRAAAGSEDELAADPCLDFLEGVKRLKQAKQEGGQCLASVHDFGRTDGGAWFATDYCERGSLEDFIGKLRPSSAGLRQVVSSLVTGCLALKRSSGRSHGGLEASNVLIASKDAPLPKAALELTDPYPASVRAINRLGPADRREASELLAETMESEDLRGIGRLILQLVEQRHIRKDDEYNYPIQVSPGWTGLGKDYEQWLRLCNELLNPNRMPGTITLESLATQFRPSGRKLPALPKLPTKVLIGAGAALVLIALISVGVVVMRKAKAGAEAKALQDYQAATNAAGTALKGSDFPEAIRQAEIALEIRPEDPFASLVLKDAQAGQVAQQAAATEASYNKAINEARASLTAKNYAEAIRQADLALAIRPSDSAAAGLKAEADRARSALTQAERDYQSATNASGAALRQRDYPEAIRQADLALMIRPTDAPATSLKQQAQQGQAAMVQAENDYQSATNAAGVALGQKNYSEAARQADLALAIKPADATATSLKQQAQAAQAATVQSEKDYQAATNAAGVALVQKNYAEALRQAELALTIKPQDATAASLKQQAQQGQQSMAQAEREYQSATNAAGVAWRAKDYPEVVKQADLALAIKPQDATATSLKQQAQQAQRAMAQAERDYQSATNAAGVAWRAKDYPEVVQQADLALAIKPQDATATSLKQQAQQAQQAMAQAERDYQSATNAAGVAWRAKDYPEVVQQADLALAIKPQDATAASLKQQAQQAQRAMAQAERDYQSATNAVGLAMANKDYVEAIRQADLALAVKPADRAATSLKERARKEQEAMAQAEQNYQSAMKEAQEAVEKQQWQVVVTKADEALKYQPGDAAAGKLKTDAQAKVAGEQGYAAALKAGQEAFAAQQWTVAVTKADEALKFKAGDAAAGKLKADAQANVAGEQGYAAALQAGQEAFAAQQWTVAVTKADEALKFKAGDAAAGKLKTDAQAKVAAEQGYAAALKAGQEAFAAQQWTVAVTKADEALKFKPGDAAANKLKTDAQAMVTAAASYPQATTAFEAGRYEQALELCKAHAVDPRFVTLQSKVAGEYAKWTNAQALFRLGTDDAAHYVLVERQLADLGTKTEVAGFLADVRAEKAEYDKLATLRTTNTWSDLNLGVNNLEQANPVAAAKRQFSALKTWRDKNDPKWVLLNQLEVLKIVTNVQKDNPRKLVDPILRREARALSAVEKNSASAYYDEWLRTVENQFSRQYPADYKTNEDDIKKVRKNLR